MIVTCGQCTEVLCAIRILLLLYQGVRLRAEQILSTSTTSVFIMCRYENPFSCGCNQSLTGKVSLVRLFLLHTFTE